MASIRRRSSGKELKWQVRWLQEGAAKCETFDTELGAVAFRGQVDSAGQRWPENWVSGVGFVTPVKEGGPTLTEWFERAMASRSRANARTRADYRRDFRLHVPQWLAATSIEAINREDVGRWLIELQDAKLSAKSIHNIHGMVSSVMKDAQQDDLIRRNPFFGQTKAITIRHEEMTFLTPQEYGHFREYVLEYYRPFTDLLFTTGLRFGEATALVPEHLELANRRLHVVTSWKRQPGGEFLSQEPKSAKGRRAISLTDQQIETLTALAAATTDNRLLFTNRNGGRIKQNSFHGHIWQPALKLAREDGFLKQPRPHDLRHSHAAYLISINQPMLAISRRLGHASTKMTNDRYGHLLPEVDQSMIAAMELIGY